MIQQCQRISLHFLDYSRVVLACSWPRYRNRLQVRHQHIDLATKLFYIGFVILQFRFAIGNSKLGEPALSDNRDSQYCTNWRLPNKPQKLDFRKCVKSRELIIDSANCIRPSSSRRMAAACSSPFSSFSVDDVNVESEHRAVPDILD